MQPAEPQAQAAAGKAGSLVWEQKVPQGLGGLLVSPPRKSVSENPKAGPRAHILSAFSCGQEVELSTSQEDSWLVTSPGPPAGQWQSQDLNLSCLATRTVQ